MDRLEDRIRALETQLGRYRVLMGVLYLVVALVLVACAAFVISNLLGLREHMNSPTSAPPRVHHSTLRVGRLEVFDGASTRPVCVLRPEEGGGRIEVMGRMGRPTAGFDGNAGLVVRSVDGQRFPETRPPR
jgi:hypothetical protein